MIKKLSINNFRNIEAAEYDLGQTNIISGENGLGKSNTLNALMWLLTDTLLTDKFGSGENQIDSIIPFDFKKGKHTSVSITLDNGKKYTKIYKTDFEKNSDRVKGHHNEFMLNDVVVKTKNEFYEKLYTDFNFKEAFKAPYVNEVNLFTDPLYALLKLDKRVLRDLLIHIGCGVSNEELYAQGFEELRAYENKYDGKFETMRFDLMKANRELTKEQTILEAKLEDYANVEENDPSKIKTLNDKKSELLLAKSKLQVGNTTSEIKELELKIKELSLDKQNKIAETKTKFQSELNKILNEIESIKAKKATALDEVLKNLKIELLDIQTKKAEVQSSKATYEAEVNGHTSNIKYAIDKARRLVEDKTSAAIDFEMEKNKKFDDYITCPHCGGVFSLIPDAEVKFNDCKLRRITELENKICDCKQEEAKLKETCENENKLKASASLEVSKLSARLNELINLETEKQMQIEYTTNNFKFEDKTPELMTEAEQIKTAIYSISFPEIDSQIEALSIKRSNLILQSKEVINDEIAKLDIQINEVEEQLKSEYIIQSKLATKTELEGKLARVVEQINDNDFLIAKVNDFIHKMIECINTKALAKTGIHFVMLEENLSNSGLTETCYATFDGIEFAFINSSQKIVEGIKFIERLKEIAKNDFNVEYNTLPILADKLEGIDHEERLFNLTKEQLIATRVSEDAKIKINTK